MRVAFYGRVSTDDAQDPSGRAAELVGHHYLHVAASRH